MKNVILFLILTLGWSKLSAQTGEACAPYDDTRTKAGMLLVINQDGEYGQNLRTAYADAINTYLGRKEVGNTKEWMICAFKHITLMKADEFIIPSNFYNGEKKGNEVVYTDLLGRSSTYWAVYHSPVGQEDVPCGKAGCVNPQKIKIPPTHVPTPEPIRKPPVKPLRLVDEPHNNLVIVDKPTVDLHLVDEHGNGLGWKIPLAVVAAAAIVDVAEHTKKAPAPVQPGGPGGAIKTDPPDTTSNGGPGGAPSTPGGAPSTPHAATWPGSYDNTYSSFTPTTLNHQFSVNKRSILQRPNIARPKRSIAFALSMPLNKTTGFSFSCQKGNYSIGVSLAL